jgi:hypothetical protein
MQPPSQQRLALLAARESPRGSQHGGLSEREFEVGWDMGPSPAERLRALPRDGPPDPDWLVPSIVSQISEAGAFKDDNPRGSQTPPATSVAPSSAADVSAAPMG